MRIDLTNAAASQMAELNPNQVNGANVAASGAGNSEDRTSFSSDTLSLSSLLSTAMSSPEIRDDKVASLQQAVNNGTYSLNPNEIAGSMIDEHA
jgi:negative regulator of flagellin synthesis FlgM